MKNKESIPPSLSLIRVIGPISTPFLNSMATPEDLGFAPEC